MHGTRDQKLDTDNVLMLLLFGDVLTHVNRFLKFLQTLNLIYANVNAELIQLKSTLKRTEENNGPLFTKHAVSFLELAIEEMELSRRLLNNNLMCDKKSPTQRINKFKTNIKAVFMRELLDESDKELTVKFF